MMSIAAMAQGHDRYYSGLATSNYYSEGGERPGVWLGSACERLGLKQGATVQAHELRNLFRGYSIDGSKPLVQNAAPGVKKPRRPGWDCCAHMTKEGDVLWAVSGAAKRKQIEAAHEKGVRALVTFVEDHLAYTRKKVNGVTVKEAAPVVAAAFTHHSSRAAGDQLHGDPHLHTHVAFLNLTVDEHGTFRTIDGRPLYFNKMLLGAIYRAVVSYELTRLGLRCKRRVVRPSRRAVRDILQTNSLPITKALRLAKEWISRRETTFEIVGVPRSLVAFFSKRRREILELLKAQKREANAVEAAKACLETRSKKGHIALEVLLERWRADAAKHGFSQEQAEVLFRGSPRVVNEQRAFVKCFAKAVKTLIHHPTKSSFSYADILRETCIQAQGRAVSFETIQKEMIGAMERAIDKRRLVGLGVCDGMAHFAGATLAHKELDILHFVHESKNQTRHVAPPEAIDLVIKNRYDGDGRRVFNLNAEQKNALRQITTAAGSVQIVSGAAGTGKSSLMRAAAEVWNNQDLRVLGLAPSGKAARGLQDGAGIQSITIAKFLKEQDKAPWRIDKIRLSAKSVVVIDECAMVSSELLHRVISKVKEVGAKVILAGDHQQLQPIDRGQMFSTIQQYAKQEKLPIVSELKENVRIQKEWMKEAAREMAAGNAAAALKLYEDHGCLKIGKTRESTIESLVAAFVRDGMSPARLKDKLVLVGLNAEAKLINTKIQKERRGWAKYYDFAYLKFQGQKIFRGDRVVFGRNHHYLGVQNGSLGTVKAVDTRRRHLTVKLDSGETVVVGARYYKDLDLAYALNTWRAQGETKRRIYCLVGTEQEHREKAYVDITRAKEKTVIYCDRANEKSLAERMSRSRAKDSAFDAVLASLQEHRQTAQRQQELARVQEARRLALERQRALGL